MDKFYDVVIVGGGVIGCSSAYHLGASNDFDGKVAVIERDPSYEGAPSARASGGIRQQFSTAENIQMGLAGAKFVKHIDEFLSVDDEPVGLVFREQGYLLLANTQHLAAMHSSHATQLALGAAIQFRSPAQLKDDFPWLNNAGLAGGFFGASNEGWVDPYSLLMAFRRKARSLGVEFIHDKATALLREGNRVIGVRLQSGGDIGAHTVINTAGASGGRALAGSAGVDVPIESRQRTSFIFECKDDLRTAPLTVFPNGLAWRPEGTRHLTSIAPVPANDPERFDFDIDERPFFDVIWPTLAEQVPAFEAIKLVNSYCCHYDVNTLDENLIIGPVPTLDNFYLAVGLSGHGMQQSPAIGRALSELICFGEYRSIDLTRFGYERVLTGEGIHETNCW